MPRRFLYPSEQKICINYISGINIWTVKENLRQLLAQRQKCRIVDTGRLPSAVLLPLYNKHGQYHLLFIKRSETVKEHKGQISFPGGTRDEIDGTLLDTALRECAEEISLRSEDAEVLGELDDEVTTTSKYIVSPFSLVIPNSIRDFFFLEVNFQALLRRFSMAMWMRFGSPFISTPSATRNSTALSG